MSFIAAIDAGASEIKACIFDLQGNVVASASRSCPRDSPETGWAQYSSDLLTKWPVSVLKDAINLSDISVKEIHTIGELLKMYYKYGWSSTRTFATKIWK